VAKAGGKGETGTSRVAKNVSSPWEYVVGVLGALVVLGAIGVMLFEGATRRDSPPDLRVAVDSVMRIGEGWLVEVRVSNEGGATAAQVNVEGELRATEPPETSGATIDYVPAESFRRAGLIFSEDPRGKELELRVTGYDLP
jgi:uncharacterized protein (TIGR02588 family)